MPLSTPSRHEVADGVEREVRVDATRAVPEQQREVMHLARFTRLDEEPDRVRVFSRTRWWCTAAVINSAGIGAFSASA